MKKFTLHFLALVTLTMISPLVRAEIISQNSDDVQILQAWRAEPANLDINQCSGRDPVEGETVTKDCTAFALQATKAPWADRESPSVNSWLLPVSRYQNYLYTRIGAGHIVEVRALVKRGVLDAQSFTGIGFYFSNMLEQGVRFINKNDLHVVSSSDVFLATNGEPAAVLRFVMYMPAYQGASGTSWSMDSVSFKPFVQFDADGKTWQNWESVPSNYTIYRQPNGGGRHQSISFDRQYELLRP